MNITFLIGNGLDLQFGLKTSYCDFYKYILLKKYKIEVDSDKMFDKKNVKNIIYKSIVNSDCSINMNWSDFELELGKYTKNSLKVEYDNAQSNEEKHAIKERFINDLDEVCLDLADYLKLAEEEFSLKEIKNNDIIIADTLNLFCKGLLTRDKIFLQNFLGNATQNHTVNFISFNYTNCLDEILKKGKTSYNKILEKGIATNYRVSVNSPIHVHGEINKNLTLGVNDVSQLYEIMFSDDDLMSLLKPLNLDTCKELMKEESESAINSSSIIVIFGMSLGNTDLYWWDYIIKWLQKGNRVVIIQEFTNGGREIDQTLARTRRKLTKEVEDKFLAYSNLSDEEKKELRQRIFVEFNNKNIFNTKG